MTIKCPICGTEITRLPVTFEAVERTVYSCEINVITETVISPGIKESTFFVENVRYSCSNCNSPLHGLADSDINKTIARLAIAMTKKG